MSEADKRSRRGRKSALTREINDIHRLIAEDGVDEVRNRIAKLKEKFNEFEKAHDKYHDELQEDAAIDESEEYFSKVQLSYIENLTVINKYVREQMQYAKSVEDAAKPLGEQSESQSTSSNYLSRQEVIDLMNLPKVEIETFSGDPLKYHSFMAVFDENVHRHRVSNKVKLTRLMQYTDKKAKDAIRACTVREDDSGYEEARQILKKRFGSNILICQRTVDNIKTGPSVKSPTELQELADELSMAYATLNSMNRLCEVDSQSTIVEIMGRLQPYLRNRWKREAIEKKRSSDEYPNFKDFVTFVSKQADEATDPYYGNLDSGKKTVSSKVVEKKSSTSFSTNVQSNGAGKSNHKCIICPEFHRLFHCEKFKLMKPTERNELVKSHKLCANCLLGNHVTSDCRWKPACTVPGCGMRHSKYLHLTQASRTSPSRANSGNEVETAQVTIANACNDDNVNVCVPVVPVVVEGSLLTHALLDNGSTNSFCTESLVNKLQIEGVSTNLTISTLSSCRENKLSKLVNFTIRSKDGSGELKLSNVYVIKEIPVTTPKFDKSSYTHLVDLPVEECGVVDILIGQDHSEALFPLKTRNGKRGEPFAVQTLLGWAINGPVSVKSTMSKHVMSNFILAQSVEENIGKLWDIENDSVDKSDVSWSKEDKRVIQFWDENAKIVNGKYELPVPWKPDCKRPNNVSVALSRLKSLKASLVKRNLLSRYHDEIVKLLQKGYAEIVPKGEVENQENVWYLPHQAVINDKKPDKVRVVFDCASKFEGESLNDKSFQGPNLNNDLLHVLLRFRQHSYALTADVEAMYNQVQIPVDDRNMLRFLWYDESGNLMHCRMTSHLFGGVWCASSSTYAMRRVLEDFEGVSDSVADVILRNFYVDDCLISFETKEKASIVASELRNLLGKASFKLTKFIANHEEILSSVPEEERAVRFKEFGPDANSRVLGVGWNVGEDELYFKVDASVCDSISKRKILSIVSAIFDPLGLITPVTILGRMIFQDVTRLKLAWDELVPIDVLQKWNVWIQSLKDLHFLQIPRCIKPAIFDEAVIQLHFFCDASLKAYGGCCYIRCIDKEGRIHTGLIMSKARVAPMKYHTIPRLELQSAVVVAKMSSMLAKQLDLSVVQTYFWTDSQIVLKYIQNDSRRFHTFVANRVSTICELTDQRNWFHISGKENPADMLTRGEDPRSMDIDKWLLGPSFLRSYASEWPKSKVESVLLADDPEVKSNGGSVSKSFATQVVDHPLDAMIGRYSSWYKLKRAVAWLLRLKLRLQNKPISGSKLSVKEINDAEIQIIRHVQMQCYEQEIAHLENDQGLGKSSVIKDLSPVLDPNGIICVGGRIKHAKVSDLKRHPYVIPHRHPVARMIVNDLHNVAHLGVEWTLSLLRAKYWITRARVLIKSVKSACITCRKLYAAPCKQKMSDLPAERLESGHPPFHYTGVDCFGPFYVKVGRSNVKRYGCVFTCLNTRAVHIEKLYTLETDSFLNGFRKFVSRRGMPAKVWSDNGLNFVGSQNEIVKSMQEIDINKVQDYSVQNGVEWSFIPPNAPHMGGIWERIVGVIKRVLSSLLMGDHARLTDEILDCVFCEVEAIVNSRPITKVSDSCNDPSALTPNHLLLMRDGPVLPPGVFKQNDMYKRRWKYVQHVSNEFWKRWLKEYLPELQKRSKWLKICENVGVGDLVLVVGENTPRYVWPIGVVSKVKKSDDGLVRSVTVRTKTSELCRPIHKIVLLESHL